MSVTIGGLDLENNLLNGEKRDIEGTTSKIETENVSLLSLLSIKTICNSGSSWLVDDSKYVDTSDGTGILGGLSLCIVKVSWNGNDSRLDGLSEERLGDFLHLGEDHR